jgi:hypothetical protein
VDKEDIIRIAQEAGFMEAGHPMNPWSAHTDQIEVFAALVAAHEREQAAKVCDDWPNGRDDVYSIGVAIRARGEK